MATRKQNKGDKLWQVSGYTKGGRYVSLQVAASSKERALAQARAASNQITDKAERVVKFTATARNPGFFSKTSVAGARRVKRVHLVKEIYTGEIGELLTQKPALLKEGWVKVKWRNRDKPTLIQKSEITPVRATASARARTVDSDPTVRERRNPKVSSAAQLRAKPNVNKLAFFNGYHDAVAGLANRPDYNKVGLAQSYREGYAAGEKDAKKPRRNPAYDWKRATFGQVPNGAHFRIAGFSPLFEKVNEREAIVIANGRRATRKMLASESILIPVAAKKNPSHGGAGAGATSSDVRSPTRTEVRSPTKTSTVAHTRGNITVTGGAGAGATTRVTVRRNPEKDYSEQYNVGKAKYVVNYHDGVSTHKDGSPFYDISIFKNKVKKDAFIKELKRRGYHRKNPSVDALAETFQGRASGATADFKAADSAPANLARIGKLVFLKLRDKRAQISAPGAMVAVDTRGKLWLVGPGNMFTPKAKAKGEALDYGEVDRICYLTAKQHIGNGKQTEYVHTFGEDGGKRPRLLVDHDGMPILRGGDYQIRAEGIVN